MSQKSITDVDKHVSRRMRERRQIIGVTQEGLADRLGITFQQVQKYEKGSNRMSAGRLLGVAEVLEVPVSYFFEGLDGASAGEDAIREELLLDKDGIELLRAFNRIEDKQMRRAIINVAKAAGRSS